MKATFNDLTEVLSTLKHSNGEFSLYQSSLNPVLYRLVWSDRSAAFGGLEFTSYEIMAAILYVYKCSNEKAQEIFEDSIISSTLEKNLTDYPTEFCTLK